MRVNEIRKRLAKHYQTVIGVRPVRFEILTGNYRVRFIRAPKMEPDSSEVQPLQVAPRRPWKISPQYIYAGLMLVVIGAAIGLLAGSVWLRSPAKGVAEEFWEPALRSPQPVILCVGHRLSSVFPGTTGAAPTQAYQIISTS